LYEIGIGKSFSENAVDFRIFRDPEVLDLGVVCKISDTCSISEAVEETSVLAAEVWGSTNKSRMYQAVTWAR
jgi:hypothetical protein